MSNMKRIRLKLRLCIFLRILCIIGVISRVKLRYFYKKNRKGKLKILAQKLGQKIEETITFKSLFDLSRYLDPLPRYKDPKFP